MRSHSTDTDKAQNLKTKLACYIGMDYSPIGNYFGGAKRLHQTRIDLNDIIEWISACNSNHDECRLSEGRVSPPRSLLVLDVKDMRVARLPSGGSYMALSYVWGHIKHLQLTRGNLGELKERGSLRKSWGQLSQTIKDAIILTASIQSRYLWVDSLCIVQDDETNKMMHVLQMASIYTHASVTIVAADGADADHGLRGVGQSSRSNFSQPSLCFAPSAQIAIRPAQSFAPSAKLYFHRGWTFQEFYLSKRLLVL